MDTHGNRDSGDDKNQAHRPTPRRRMADHKVDVLVNSPWLKLAGYVLNGILGVVITISTWIAGTILDRLNQIEAGMAATRVERASDLSRMQYLEKSISEVTPRVNSLSDKMIIIEHEVKSLKEPRQTYQPQRP